MACWDKKDEIGGRRWIEMTAVESFTYRGAFAEGQNLLYHTR